MKDETKWVRMECIRGESSCKIRKVKMELDIAVVEPKQGLEVGGRKVLDSLSPVVTRGRPAEESLKYIDRP